MIEWEFLAPMITIVVFTLTLGGVLVLRPIATKLGALLEVMTREKLEGNQREELAHVRELLETMHQRLELMEDRQEFTERLIADRSETPKELPPQG